MALIRISTQKMISLSLEWVETRRGVLSAIPQAAAVLPDLDNAHRGLVIFQKPAPAEDKTLLEVREQISAGDLRHDDLLRGGYYLLTGLSFIAAAQAGPEAAERFLTLRGQLYPDDLSGTRRSIDEEAGAAEQLAGLLESASFAAELAAIEVKTGNGAVQLRDLVAAQIAAGRGLGALSKQRRQLEEQAASQITGPVERQRRNAWITAVRSLEQNLKLAVRNKIATAEVAADLLKELRAAEEEADRRYLARKKEEAEAEADKPEQAGQAD
jgi:hypothetical protein